MDVLITGANRGIGAALLTGYRARGDRALGTSRAGDADLLPLDVTDASSHAALAARLAGQPIDLLICNAGVYLDRHEALADGYGPDLWALGLATNVTGVFLSIQSLLPHLRAAKAAKIAIISSQMGSSGRASGGSYIYRASKAAAVNLGRNLARDLAGDGISVGIYHPGWVQTDMGGSGASITPEASAKGLIARFDALSPTTTGVFEAYDGQAMTF